MLQKVSKEIRDLPNQIRIEGHTDNRPISTVRYPSNWELSSARATSVVRYLIDVEKFSPDKLSALGFGEFRPIAPNDSDINRAKNRRIDIVVLTDDLSRYEPASIDTAWKETIKHNDGNGNNIQANTEQNSTR
jgi:chemotaxis protein MotB